MHYSNTRSRAGLVALVFTLIISLVAAAPIRAAYSEPSSSSTLSPLQVSNPSLNGQVGISEISLSGRMSTLPTATRTLTRRHISTDMDDQLVRRSVGSKIKAAFRKAGKAIKHGFQKLGKGIVTAAKKVGKFIKKTGAKIIKFGMKVLESVGDVVGKVVGFIPGLKPLGKAIEGVSKVAGVISDHIHTHLSKALEKGMRVMEKANKILRFVPRRRDLSEEEAFQHQDISDAYYFEERDDITLENRGESYFEANERDVYY